MKIHENLKESMFLSRLDWGWDNHYIENLMLQNKFDNSFFIFIIIFKKKFKYFS